MVSGQLSFLFLLIHCLSYTAGSTCSYSWMTLSSNAGKMVIIRAVTALTGIIIMRVADVHWGLVCATLLPSGVALQARCSPLPIFYVTLEHSHELPVAAFTLRGRSQVAMTETLEPAKSEVVTVRAFTEKVYWPLVYILTESPDTLPALCPFYR